MNVTRRLMDSIHGDLARVERRLTGLEMQDILKVGGFPSTETKAALDALSALQDAMDELTMGLQRGRNL